MEKRKHIYAQILLVLFMLCNTQTEAQIAPIKDQADAESYVDHIDRLQFQHLDSAILLWEELGSWSDKHSYIAGQKEYYRTGIYLHGVLLSDKDMGKELAEEALNFSRKELPENVPAVWISKAILFQAYTELDSAIAYYEKALQALDHQHPNYPVVLGNLASIYDQLKLPQPAQNYAEEALQIYQSEKDTLGITTSLLSLANVALLEDDAEQNYQFLSQAYELSKASSQKASFVQISHNLAYAYIEKGDLSKGLQLFEEALQKSEANPTLNLHSRIGIARNLIKMNRLTEANNYRDQVIHDSAQVAMPLKLRRLLYEMEMEYFQAKGEPVRALGLLPDFLKLKEAEISEESNEYALRLNKQLENRNLAMEGFMNQIMYLEKSRQFNLLLGICLILGILAAILFSIWKRKRDRLRFQLLQSRQENLFIEREAMLKGKLDERDRISKELHDEIGASVTTIALQSELLKRKLDVDRYPEISKIFHYASEVMQDLNEVIWANASSNDSLQSLISYCVNFSRKFLDTHQILGEWDLPNLEIDLPIGGDQRRNVYLIFKEALHNVVKHAGASQVQLAFRWEDDWMKMLIWDNGSGRLEEGKGNGISNMKERAQKLGAELYISDEAGTRLELIFPISQAQYE